MIKFFRSRRELAMFGIGGTMGVELCGATLAQHLAVGIGTAVAGVAWAAVILALIESEPPPTPSQGASE